MDDDVSVDPDKSSTLTEHTDKEFLLNQFVEKLHGQKYGLSLSSLEDKNLTKKPKMELTPENRVDIEMLMKNIGTTLEGQFFLGRCITPPLKMTAIMTLLDDPEGKQAVRLALYNYSSEMESKFEQVLAMGTIVAVLNPFFKPAADGGLIIRCDNPTDVIVLEEEKLKTLFPDLKWNAEIVAITSSPKPKTTDEEALDFKDSGNKSFRGQKYVKAIDFYTRGLEIAPRNVDLLLNRAASYIQMGCCYNKALADTALVLEVDPFNIKGIYRTVKSLWGLNRYREATELLDQKFSEKPELKKLKELMDVKQTAGELLEQHETGFFDMLTILEKQYKDIPLQLAEFTGPVKIAEIEGKGRGLVTTDEVEAGQLLISSRAFACNTVISNKIKVAEKRGEIVAESKKKVLERIAEKLRLEPELGREFYQLFAGPELGSLASDHEKIEEFDMARIDQIFAYNSFSRIETKDDPQNVVYIKTSIDVSFNVARNGLWILPSYINHSCSAANCFWDIHSDMMLIRAVKPIAKGEEILISYIVPTWDFEQRRAELAMKGFLGCDCSICSLEGKEDEGIRGHRCTIISSLEKSKDYWWDLSSLMEFDKDLSKVVKLEELDQDKIPSLRFSLANPVILQLAFMMYRNTLDNSRCVEVYEKAHLVMKEAGMAKEALSVAMATLGSILTILVNPLNPVLVKKWIKIVKEDLLIAYSSLEPFRFLGVLMLDELMQGINFFDD